MHTARTLNEFMQMLGATARIRIVGSIPSRDGLANAAFCGAARCVKLHSKEIDGGNRRVRSRGPGIPARLARATRRESLVFLVGTAIIAVHLVDDNFLQPQPGTSAADHLVSGMVPRAVLAIVAAVYPRVRAGFRAAIALVLGVLAVVAGAGEAAYYTAKVGASGNDYTGFLTLAAGLLLLAVGTATLWRTRRLDERLPRRYLRRAR